MIIVPPAGQAQHMRSRPLRTKHGACTHAWACMQRRITAPSTPRSAPHPWHRLLQVGGSGAIATPAPAAVQPAAKSKQGDVQLLPALALMAVLTAAWLCADKPWRQWRKKGGAKEG
jgi:hypothetical protein